MQIRRIATVVGVLAIGIPQAVRADEGEGWYVSGSATLSQLKDTAGTIANAPVPGSTVRSENSFETGIGGSIAIGRDFGRFRAEVEAGYTSDSQNSYTSIAPPTGRIVANVDQTTLRGMANGYFDITDGPIQPYVGAGLGITKIDLLFIAPRAPFPTEDPRRLIDGDDTRFAYQIMGGVSARISKSLSFTLQYRWFDAGTVTIADSRGEATTRDVAGHHIDAGLRVTF